MQPTKACDCLLSSSAELRFPGCGSSEVETACTVETPVHESGATFTYRAGTDDWLRGFASCKPRNVAGAQLNLSTPCRSAIVAHKYTRTQQDGGYVSGVVNIDVSASPRRRSFGIPALICRSGLIIPSSRTPRKCAYAIFCTTVVRPMARWTLPISIWYICLNEAISAEMLSRSGLACPFRAGGAGATPSNLLTPPELPPAWSP